MAQIVTKQELLVTTTLPLDQNPAAVFLSKLPSAYSRSSLRWCLDLAGEILVGERVDSLTLDWRNLRYQHLAALRAKLLQTNPRPGRVEPYSVSTINMVITAVKGTVREAWKLELISDSVYLRIMAEKGVKGDSPPAGRLISEDEKRALFKACERDPTICGVRDGAVFAVMFGAGLRRSEVVQLDLEDWHPEDRLLIVRRGKGRHFREVPCGQQVKQAIDDWLSLRGNGSGPMFLPIRWRDKIERRRLNSDTVYNIVYKRSHEAEIEKTSPHDLRRTYITDLLNNDIDLATVAKLAGHRQIQTTSLYDKRGMKVLREAAETVEVPYLARRERQSIS